ncbi:ABC transporter substrate-binding protein [Konateibacter massiliensis]|uniref:ABC transporter substrate-binding protein n=1 Tax=Konateibacter massiliensis TaxID=2002841 RepID=UPI000C14CE89|nr:ABC transporter substrate-binding protein [Konateibacter massiliensis]
MMVRMKKFIALLSVAALSTGLLAGCGSGTANETTKDSQSTEASKTEDATDTNESTDAASSTELSGVEISFLNSKGEIQSALEEMAVRFEAESGIKVDVIACGAGEVPYTKITSAYNSGTAPTMAMLDTTDIVALAEEYALDLSNEKWLAECETQVTKVNDAVYSFPFCIEGRGLIYNKTAIKETLGEDFDAATINSYDALKSLLENLRAKGMENPVVISKEDWSLGAHQLGFIYDTYDGTTAGSTEVINKLKSGELAPADYERFNQFVDTMDLLLEYNINGKDPLGALYEQDPIFLADGDAAIWANGCWAWPNIEEAGASTTDEYGFLPFVLGNDTTDFANTGIQASPTKQVMIDKVQATEEQQAAAKEFLNWIVYAEAGQQMLVETCALIPACDNNTYQPLDPLGKDIKTKMAEGNTFNSSFIAPSDHWSVMGAAMQKYIAKQSTKEELAQSLSDYWTAQK